MGATGLETDAWVTADGVAVLDHDGVVRRGVRRRTIAEVHRGALPPSVPSLGELYEACGTTFELSIDVHDTPSAQAVVEAARAAAPGAPKRLWLCHADWRRLLRWREAFPDVRLVNSTRIRDIKEGPERRAAEMARAGIDAINLHHTDWTGGLTTLFHRFGVLGFGWDAQHERMLRNLVNMGIDGVFSDHVDRMVDVIGLA